MRIETAEPDLPAHWTDLRGASTCEVLPDPRGFLYFGYGDHRDLHSFPTRRSSDLGVPRRGAAAAADQRGVVGRDRPGHLLRLYRHPVPDGGAERIAGAGRTGGGSLNGLGGTGIPACAEIGRAHV